jgi:hypothetical protein
MFDTYTRTTRCCDGLRSLASTLHVGGVDGRWLGSFGQKTSNLEGGNKLINQNQNASVHI